MTRLHAALAFASIIEDSRSLNSPTLDQVQLLTPHIDNDVVAAKFAEATEGDDAKSWYFAVPGVHVQGSVHVFSLSRHKGTVTLRRAMGHNVLYRGGWSPNEYDDDAHTWQQANVDYDRLINPLGEDGRPRWCWFQSNPVKDPTRRVPDYFAIKRGADPSPKAVEPGRQDGRPVGICSIAFVYEYGKDPNSRQGQFDKEADADLAIHSSQYLLWNEVKDATRSTGAAPTNWCAVCGNSLHMTGCAHCGYFYRDNQFDPGGGPAIGPQAKALTEKVSNWTFTGMVAPEAS